LERRPSKADAVSADEIAVSAGGVAAPHERLFDIIQRVGRIESSVTYLEAQGDKLDTKLDTISHEMAAAKATFGTLKTIGVAICIGVWGLISAIVIAWLIHYWHLTGN
jgi:outer membrane murein-binding lipoprotein Lpp